jgi:hypothetical protein
MKVALCFHGLPRLIEQCYPDIYNYFIKNNNVDIYAHFWWNDDYKGKINRLHVLERYPVDIDPIHIFKKLYSPTKIQYDDFPIDFDGSEYNLEGFSTARIKDDILFNKICASITIYGAWYCRFTSVNKVIKLIDNINEYDLIVIIRSDTLTFNKHVSITNEINDLNFEKYIYFPSTKEGGQKYAGEFPNRIGDWLFMGNPKNILAFSDKIIDMIKNNNSNSITPLHNTQRLTYWAKHAGVELNIYNSSISVRRYIVEEWENINYLNNNKINKEFYIDHFDRVNNKFNYHDLLPAYVYNVKFIK